MMINDITAMAGRYKNRKRLGRGHGSGTGKQSGKGHKGAYARSGTTRRYAYEGGQMPYFRRLPKQGFTNAPFKAEFWIVNIDDIVKHPSFAKGGEVNVASLAKAGLVRDDSRDLKILGRIGEDGLRVKLNVTASRVSDTVRKMVTGSGGSVTETGTSKDRTRGVDRNSEDRSPKNLTKKAKRSAGYAAKRESLKAKPKG